MTELEDEHGNTQTSRKRRHFDELSSMHQTETIPTTSASKESSSHPPTSETAFCTRMGKCGTQPQTVGTLSSRSTVAELDSILKNRTAIRSRAPRNAYRSQSHKRLHLGHLLARTTTRAMGYELIGTMGYRPFRNSRTRTATVSDSTMEASHTSTFAQQIAGSRPSKSGRGATHCGAIVTTIAILLAT